MSVSPFAAVKACRWCSSANMISGGLSAPSSALSLSPPLLSLSPLSLPPLSPAAAAAAGSTGTTGLPSIRFGAHRNLRLPSSSSSPSPSLSAWSLGLAPFKTGAVVAELCVSFANPTVSAVCAASP